MLIVGLAAALLFLVLYRQRRQQQAHRREEEEARRRQQGGQGQNPAQRQDRLASRTAACFRRPETQMLQIGWPAVLATKL